MPRPSTTIGSVLMKAPCGKPRCPATSSTLVRPGVSTSSGASSGGGSSTGCAVAEATSTLAA